MDDLQTLVDRQAILDCLHRYCRGVDRLDRELILSAFHEDAVDVHGELSGSPLEFVEKLFRRHTGRENAMHMITNHVAEIAGDTAHAETYWLSPSRGAGDDVMAMSAGRYVDRLEKRDGQWKIAARVVVIEWRTSGPAAALPDDFVKPRRDAGDVSYHRPLDPLVAIQAIGTP